MVTLWNDVTISTWNGVAVSKINGIPLTPSGASTTTSTSTTTTAITTTMSSSTSTSTTAPSGPLEAADHTILIEGGSWKDFAKVDTNEFEFTLDTDTAFAERYWFGFEITGNAGGKTVTYTVNVEASISGPNAHTPAYSFDDGVTWSYIPQVDVSYYTAGDNYMEFDITFPGGQNTALIYATIPFFYTDLVAYAGAWSSGYGSVSSYASELGRNCYIFTIDNGDPTGKTTIWVIAGQEPSETWAQYITLGLIDHLISPGGATLRAEHNWKIIPTINPDGNYLGKTQRNGNNVDLTVEWNPARSGTAEDEIQGCVDAIGTYNTAGYPIKGFIDMHCRYTYQWLGINCSNAGWFDDYNEMLEFEAAIKTPNTRYGLNGWSHSCSGTKSWGQIPAEFGCATVLTETTQRRSVFWLGGPTATVALLMAYGETLGDALEGYSA